ncbi:MAG: succinyl-diaminopimelate desuccinylase [Rhodospirillales bacterium]
MSAKDDTLNPGALATALMRRPSITPRDEGVLDTAAKALESAGFTCHRLTFSEPGTEPVDNLFAERGAGGPVLGFAGHTDVVPPGDAALWAHDPFDPQVRDGFLYGRGASDMKTAVAAFITACARADAGAGALRVLLTNDEEGPAVNGTRKILDWMRETGRTMDACIVGEPTSAERLGDVIKIGRRGSLTGALTVAGAQGHAAYPQLANNPVHAMMRYLGALIDEPFDGGSEHFPATAPAVTSVDTGNEVTNVIPAQSHARFNIRFNDQHSGAALEALVRSRFDAAAAATDTDYELSVRVSAEPFLTPPGRLSETVSAAVKDITGASPETRTDGGTSDARFIKDMCPVAEFGMLNAGAHKVDERIPAEDVETLTQIYGRAIERFFAGS